MRKNTVYSLVALSALPMGAQATIQNVQQVTETDNWSGLKKVVLASDDTQSVATETPISLGTLVPGDYYVRVVGQGSVSFKVMAGDKVIYEGAVTNDEVFLPFKVETEGEIVLVASATDTGVTVSDLTVTLEPDEDKVKALVEELQNELNDLLAKQSEYTYEGAGNDIQDAAGIDQEKINEINQLSYESYVKYELYNETETAHSAPVQAILDDIAKLAQETAAKQAAKDKADNEAAANDLSGSLDESKTALDNAKTELANLEPVTDEDKQKKTDLEAQLKEIQEGVGGIDEVEKQIADELEAGTLKDNKNTVADKISAINQKITDAQTAINTLKQSIADAAAAEEQAAKDTQAKLDEAKDAFNGVNTDIISELNKDPYKGLYADAREELDKVSKDLTDAQAAADESADGGTALADKEANTKAAEDAKKAVEEIQEKYLGENGYKAKYDAKIKKVEDLQKKFDDAVKGIDKTVASDFEEAEAEIQKQIDAVGFQVIPENKNADTEFVDAIDIDDDITAAEGEIDKLTAAATLAKTNYDNYQATLQAIGAVEQALSEATTEISAKKYTSEGDVIAKYNSNIIMDFGTAIGTAKTEAEEAYNKAKAKTSALDTESEEATYNYEPSKSVSVDKINTFKENALAAVEKFETVQKTIADNQKKLDEAKAKAATEWPNVSKDDDFKAINDKIAADNQALDAAMGKEGQDHIDAMLALDIKDLSNDINQVVEDKKAEQKQYEIDKAKEAMATVLAEAQKLLEETNEAFGELTIAEDNTVGQEKKQAISDRIEDISQAITDDATAIDEVTDATAIEQSATIIADLKDQIDALKNVSEDIKSLKDNTLQKVLADAVIDELQKDLDDAKQAVADADKSENDDVLGVYEEDFNEIQQAINDLKDEVAENYKNLSLVDEEVVGNVSKEVDNITKDIDATKADALAYCEIYQRYLEVKEALDDEKVEFAAADQGAAEYYNQLLDNYATDLQNAKDIMDEAKKNGTTVANKDNIIKLLDELQPRIEKVAEDAAANKEAYDRETGTTESETTSLKDVQDRWNEVYIEISAKDESSLRADWQEKLNDLLPEIEAFEQEIDDDYKAGKSVAEETNLDLEATKLIGKINDILAQQQEGYSDAIHADNADMFEAFESALGDAQKAFQEAVETLDNYRDISNPELDAIIDEYFKTHRDIYEYPELLDALKQKAKTEFTEAQAEAETKYDPEGENIKQANDYAKEIRDFTAQFLTDVTDIMQDFWAEKSVVYNQKVADAKDAISGYSEEAQKDAFKDVEDLIAAGAEAAKIADAEGKNIKKLDDVLSQLEPEYKELSARAMGAPVEPQSGIDKMLAKDKEKAAEKDLQPKLDEVREQVAKDIVAFGNLDEETQQEFIDQLEDNYTASYDAASQLFKKSKDEETLFENHDAILELLGQYAGPDIVEQATQVAKEKKENKDAFEAVMDELADAQDRLDQAKDKIGELISDQGEDDDTSASEDLEDAQEDLDDLKEEFEGYEANAKDKKAAAEQELADIIEQIEAAEQKAADATKEELKKVVDNQITAEYNRFADDFSEDVQEQAAEYKDRIEAVKETLDKADATIDEVLAAQEEVAKLYTELTNANGEVDSAAMYDDISQTLDNAEALADLSGYDEDVLEEFKEDQAHLQQEIADAKANLEDKKDQIGFYGELLKAQADALAGLAQSLKEKVDGKQAEKDAKTKANEEAFERLMNEMLTVIKAEADLEVYCDEQPYVDRENFKDDFEYVTKWIIETGGEITEKHQNGELTAESTIEGLQDKLDFIKNRKEVMALTESFGELVALQKDLNDAKPSNDDAQNYPAATWKAIQEKASEIQDAIDGLTNTLQESYDNKTCVDDLPALQEEIAKVEEMIDELEALKNSNKLGDVNGDGRVTVTDYRAILTIILKENYPEEGTPEFIAADVNSDGKINIGDATAVVNLILYGDIYGPVNARVANGIREAVTAEMLENGRIAVMLDNYNPYTAGQMDVMLPEGMTITNVSFGSRSNGHELQLSKLDNGAQRIVIFSDKSEVLKGNSGAVLYIDVDMDSSYRGGELSIENVLFAQTNAKVTEFGALNAETTGIASIAADGQGTEAYSLSGRMMNAVKKGVNILRDAAGKTKKVIVK